MTEPRRVLVVDADPAVRATLDRVLKTGPFSVHVVENGRQALDKLGAEPFDLVIVDKNLPGMAGVDIVQLLRRQDHHIGVILVTAYPTLESAKDLLHLGIDAYLTKPFSDVFDVVDTAHDAVAARDERVRASAVARGVPPKTGLAIVAILPSPDEAAWARRELMRYTTQVVGVASAAEGLDTIAAATPALAVIDSEVTDPDLFGTLSRLLVSTPKVAIVVITGAQPPLPLVSKLIDLHVSALVERPLTPQAFHDKISYVLRRAGGAGKVL